MPANDVKFSKRQLEAIEWDNNKELLISAAAGSGKTTVLISRIIDRIVNKRIPIDSFLVVTFTHASANELKEKISKALGDALKTSPDDEWLAVQLANVGRASIGTIHSFCLKAIKDYHEHPSIQLPKTVRILSEEKSKQLLQDAIDEVLAEEYSRENNNEFIGLLDTYASFKNDENVREHIKSLYRFALNNEEPYEWIEAQTQATENCPYMHIYCDFLRKTATEARLICDATLHDFSASSIYEDMLKLCSDGMTQIEEALEQDDLNTVNEIVKNKLGSIKLSGGKAKDENIALQRSVLKYIKSVHLKFLSTDGYDGDADNAYRTKNALNELCRITVLVGKRFEEKKRKAKALDYSDMEHMTLELFKDDGVAELYRSKFKHIMFDEYQDCNRIQEQIIQKIAGNAVYFMVGDVKQSIYGFRQAEPGLFLQKYLTYKYARDAEYAVIELNENYRSRSNVLNAANKVFFGIMRKDFCGMDYCADNALNAMANYPETSLDCFANEPVRLALITGKNIKDSERHKAQIMYAVDYIRYIMGSKYVYDAKIGEYRRIKYSDIAILMRSPKNVVAAIREVFAATDIPINILQDSDISFAPEISLLMCILQCIENPYNDMALMATLHSYIFDVTDNEFTELMNYGKDGAGDVISKLQRYIAENTAQDNVLLKKLKRFMEEYSMWTENAAYMPIMDFIDYIIDTTGYMEYFGSFENGRVRCDNIYRLYEALKQQLDATGGGLFECCRILKNIDENGIKAGATGAAYDAVSVMSIHKSKGLEFPVVFIMGTEKSFSDDETKKTILIHRDYGMVSKTVDTVNRIEYNTSEYEMLKRIIKKEQREEEQRILYVAMTRAKEQLVILGSASDKTLTEEYRGESITDIASSNNFLKWIIYALCAQNSSIGEPLSVQCLSKSFFTDVKDTDYTSNWAIDICKADINENGRVFIEDDKIPVAKISAEKVNEEAVESTVDDRNNSLPDIEQLKEKLLFKYAYEESTKINSKLSVSQIKHIAENTIDDDTYEIPDYRYDKVKTIFSDDGITPTRLGTLYHFFLQHAAPVYPYENESFDRDIENMLNKKLILPSEVKYLAVTKIKAFFNSDIGKRMSEAILLEREKSFTYHMEARKIFPELKTDEKIIVQGVIDCYFCDKNGNYVLIDYKTDKISEGMEHELVKRHIKQLELYRSAIKDIAGIDIKEMYIYSFALDRFVPVTVTAK